MDTRNESNAFAPARGRKLGVMGGRACATCGAPVNWRVEKFCFDQRARFGGRIYCQRCQRSIPASA